jgi:hypothetical protein
MFAVGVVVPHLASASTTTYHVATSGNDTNPGTSALPFRHIQKCADVMVAGDTCLIGGGRYRETVTPKASGTSGSPITYAPEPGASVTVDGSDPVPGGWSAVSSVPSSVNGVPDPLLAQSPFATAVAAGKVFATSVAIQQPLMGANLLGVARTENDPPPQVFYDGQMMMMAQWPPAPASEDPMHPTIEVAGDGSGATTIADPKLTQPPGYWVGAQAYVLGTSWSQTVQVVASAPGLLTVCCTVTEVSSRTDPLLAKNGVDSPAWPFSSGGNVYCANHMALNSPMTERFFLYNKLESLSGPGDWFYDTDAQQLYFYSPTGAAPAAGSVSVKRRSMAFDLATNNISYTNLSNLSVFSSTIETGAASWGNTLDQLDVNYPSYFTDMDGDPNQPEGAPGVQDCMTTGATTSGVILRGHDNVLQNSSVSNSAGNGVRLDSGFPVDGTKPGNTVTNSRIRNVGFAGAFATAAVLPSGDNNTITHNTIDHCGQACIEISMPTPLEVHNLRIAYNDVSHAGMFRLDGGAIYALGNYDFTGSRIDHNWVHDAEPLPGMYDPATAGIYIDGGAHNIQVDNNVGWNNVRGLLGFAVASVTSQYGLNVFNNDGDGFMHIKTGCDSTGAHCNRVQNNLGYISTTAQGDAPAPGIVVDHNIPAAAPYTFPQPFTDPQYTDPRVKDYRLQSTSPGRNAGVVLNHASDPTIIGDVTGGSSDSTPSAGAYQYGAARWVPGAVSLGTPVVLHYGPTPDNSDPINRGATADAAWQHPNYHPGFVVRMTNDAIDNSDWFGADTDAVAGNFTLPYINPVADASNPMFADLSNLAIDKVEIRVFARSYDHLGSVANLTVSADGLGTVWDAGGANFDSSSSGVKIDVTSAVGGVWNNLPSWVNVYATETAPAAGARTGAATGAYTAGIYLHAVEMYVTAHCVNAAAAPCSAVDNTPTSS